MIPGISPEFRESLKRAEDEKVRLRDQFAMAALTGLLANPAVIPKKDEGYAFFSKSAADAAYAHADALLAAREAK